METTNQNQVNVFGATLSRRQFIKAGGVLVVGGSLVGPKLLKGDDAKPAQLKNDEWGLPSDVGQNVLRGL